LRRFKNENGNLKFTMEILRVGDWFRNAVWSR
jgi:hypothetical protein